MKLEFEDIVVGDDADGQRLDKVLSASVPELGLRGAKRLIEKSRVLVDGIIRPKGYKLRPGQVIGLRLAQGAAQAKDPCAGVRVVKRAGELAAVFKPGGLHTEPLAGSGDPNLRDCLAIVWPERGFQLLNRLDKPTSGLVLASFSEQGRAQYREQENSGRVRKTYLCLAHGRIAREKVLDYRLRTSGREKVRVGAERTDDMLRQTTITPLRYDAKLDYCLVRAVIRKGARHQIRAHMAASGNPIVGDVLYGSTAEVKVLYLHHQIIETPEFTARVDPEWPEFQF